MLSVVLVSNVANCQNDQSSSEPNELENSVRQNEVKFNALLFILGVGEFGYERLLSENSGLGVHISFPIFIDSESEPLSSDLNYFFSPYYRVYFGKKYAAGFFVEGFGMLNSFNRRLKEPTQGQSSEDVTDFALGIGLGGKWVLKNKFVLELSWGIGRNLFNNSDYQDAAIVGRGGLSVAYRF